MVLNTVRMTTKYIYIYKLFVYMRTGVCRRHQTLLISKTIPLKPDFCYVSARS